MNEENLNKNQNENQSEASDKPIRKSAVLSKPYESAGETIPGTEDDKDSESVEDTEDEETEDAKARRKGKGL